MYTIARKTLGPDIDTNPLYQLLAPYGVGKRYSLFLVDGEVQIQVEDDDVIEVPVVQAIRQALADYVPPAPVEPTPYVPTYADLRRAAYPAIGDQLDALWKGGADADAMHQQILAVKAEYPKPTV